MSQPKPIKTAKHHWWPQCVSKRWKNSEGVVHQVFNDGRVVLQTNTRNFASINDAHTIKLSDVPTGWDQDFEGFFNKADGYFPLILNLLESMDFFNASSSDFITDRLEPQNIEHQKVDMLLEGILSLVVRSPRFRNHIRNQVLAIRNDVDVVDKSLININLRDALQRFKSSTKSRGKFCILLSNENEFIFGDGFYNNFVSSSAPPHSPIIIVPLLPKIALFYCSPMQYRSEPRVLSLNLSKEEVGCINKTTMIYSQKAIFYKSQKPEIISEFFDGEFMSYIWNHEPAWINDLTTAVAGSNFGKSPSN